MTPQTPIPALTRDAMQTLVPPEGFALVTVQELEKLTEDQRFLNELRAGGVDNWDGWGFACDRFNGEESE